MNDLEYYARNMHVWPGNDTNNVIKTLRRNPNGPGVTKDQWLAERARLQNKPSWDDAPDWAMWLCQTSKGDWFFCESKQKPNADKGWDDVDDNYAMQCMDSGEVLGDWRDTLERRPEIDIDELIDTLSEDEWNKKSVSKLTRSVEWKQGELPPIGEECEVYRNGEWEPCEIITHIEQPMGTIAVFSYGREPGYGISGVDCLMPRYFRPVDVSRAEKDRAVEEMYRDATGDDLCGDEMDDQDVVSLCQILYKAGYRKQEIKP